MPQTRRKATKAEARARRDVAAAAQQNRGHNVKVEADSDTEQILNPNHGHGTEHGFRTELKPVQESDQKGWPRSIKGAAHATTDEANPILTKPERAWRQVIAEAKTKAIFHVPQLKGCIRATGLCTTGDRAGQNVIISAILRKLHIERGVHLTPGRENDKEATQLELLHSIVSDRYKSQAKIPLTRVSYRKTNQALRPRILQAALKQLVDIKNERKAGKLVKATATKPSNSTMSAVKIEAVETPDTVTLDNRNSTVSVENPLAFTTAMEIPVRASSLSFSKPFSIYAITPASPFAALHKVQSGRVTKDAFKHSKNYSRSLSPAWKGDNWNKSPTPSLRSSSSFSLSRTSSASLPNSAHIGFGDRVEQALLKIEKWATTWLDGTFEDSNQDLAWESFEFCLRMSDILDQIKEPRVEIKTEELWDELT